MGDVIEVGQVWTHKSETWRHVTIESVHDDRYVHVKRNTSRRGQAIQITTLLRSYRRDYGRERA